jgi:hypothetical protein
VTLMMGFSSSSFPVPNVNKKKHSTLTVFIINCNKRHQIVNICDPCRVPSREREGGHSEGNEKECSAYMDPYLTLLLIDVVYDDLRTNEVSSHTARIREENVHMTTHF